MGSGHPGGSAGDYERCTSQVFKNQSDKNLARNMQCRTKVRENNELESYRPKLKDMERQLANFETDSGDWRRASFRTRSKWMALSNSWTAKR